MFNSVFNLTTLDGHNGFAVTGLHSNDFLGSSVSTAGDMNGDEIDDVVLGAPTAVSQGGAGAGASYVIFGQRSGFSASFDLTRLIGRNGFSVLGSHIGDQLGYSVSTAGDLNGDQLDDVVLGAAAVNSKQGACYIIFGEKIGFPASFNLMNLNGTNGFMVPGLNQGDYLGYSVSTAGDLNGDELDDVVLGAPVVNANKGACYIIFGQKSGFPASFDLKALNGTNGFAVTGLDADDFLGSSVSKAGDINGDGIDDLVLGAPQNDNINEPGVSYIIFGQKSAFPARFDVTTLDGSNGFTVPGHLNGDALGYSVGTAGDINGDEIDDLALGAPQPNINNNPGAAYIIFGQKSVFPARFDVTTLDGSNGFTVPGYFNGIGLGVSVGTAGDINGDGIDDLTLGAPGAEYPGRGAVYVIFGQKNAFPAKFDVTTLDGSNGFTIPGVSENDQLGYTASSAGDMNGDGLDDLVLGARQANNARGESYVIFGRSIYFPVLGANNLLALQGRAVILTPANLNATDSSTPSDDLVFTAFNVKHGQFEFVNNNGVPINHFFQQNVTQSAVQFRTDNSYVAPSYDISVKNSKGLSTKPRSASITFHDAPYLHINRLFISNNASVILSQSNLNATENYSPVVDLFFTVSNIQHGQFQWVNTTSKFSHLRSGITQFAQRNVTNGIIQFEHDGSNEAPSYEVQVSDGVLSTSPAPASVTFHDAPVLKNNRLTVNQGQSVVLSSAYLSATESYTPDDSLIFQISDVKHGQFRNTNAPDSTIGQFAQQNVTNGIIAFTQDGSSNAPSYAVTVSDGQLTSGASAPAKITFKRNGSKGSSNLINTLGGWGGIAGIIIGGFLLICLVGIISGAGIWYYRKFRAPRIRIFGNAAGDGDVSINRLSSTSSLIQDHEKQPLLSEQPSEGSDEMEKANPTDVDEENTEADETFSNPGRFRGSLFGSSESGKGQPMLAEQQQEVLQKIEVNHSI